MRAQEVDVLRGDNHDFAPRPLSSALRADRMAFDDKVLASVVAEPVEQPKSASFFYRSIGKRVLDVGLSVLILPIVLPVVALLAICVWAQDRANPFFVHQRVGRGKRLFGCLKLRSMVIDADVRLADLLAKDPEAKREWMENQKLDKDPRITRLGRFLRKSSLDELPQLWNVLRGDMSLVGPRPVVPDELLRYGPAAASYARVRPGVTGPWQVSGRNDMSYPERVRLDEDYSRHHSLFGDLKIIAMTATAVLKVTGK